MQTLQIIGKLWNDGANTYHSAEIICDYSLPTEKTFYVPFSYGYENQYIHNSIKLLADIGELPKDTISQIAVKNLGIELTTSYTNCKKRDLIQKIIK